VLTRVPAAALALVLLGSGAGEVVAQAAPATAGTTVRLSASAGRELPQDRLRAELRLNAEGLSPAEVQKAINTGMAEALDRVRGTAGLDAETGAYDLYQDRDARIWRGGQSVILDGADADVLLGVVGELQSAGFAAQNIGYYLSREAQEAVTDELTQEALRRAEERLGVVADTLGRTEFRITEVDLGGGPPEPRPLAYARAEAMVADAAPPAVEAGTTRVEVRVGVTAQLSP
jgi:predicted secreted protein